MNFWYKLWNKIKKLLIIALVAILASIFVPPIQSAVFKHSLKKDVKLEYIDEEKLEIEQESYQKSTASDIEGLSLYDKRMKGLSMVDGDDTDGDGLTDKEEIEVYGSDPSKMSTAGDMYPDGVKVKMGVDVNIPINEYTSSFSDFRHIGLFPEEVFPNPDDLTDVLERNAVIVRKDDTELEKASRLDSYAIYEIRYFGGAIAIDLSKLGESISSEDVKVWYFADYDSKEEKVTVSALDNTIAFDTRENGDGFYVVANKKKLSIIEGNKKISAIKDWFGSLKKDAEEDLEDIVYNSPDGDVKFVGGQWQVLNQLFKKMPTIYYVSSGDEGYDEEYINEAKKFCDDVIGDDYIGGVNIKRKHFEKITYTEYLAKETAWKKARENMPKVVHDYQQYLADDQECFFAFCFLTDEDYADYAGIHGKKEFLDAHRDFSLNEELPFQNFGSYISPGGNCAGIAMLTATVHNTGTFPSTGSYSLSSHYDAAKGSSYSKSEIKYDINYDLTTDEENKTLMDRYLSDYKTRGFYNKNKKKIPKRDEDGNIVYGANGKDELTTNVIDFDALTPGEKEFVNMIGVYWDKANAVDTKYLYFDNSGGYDYDYREYIPMELIDRVYDEIKDGKILYLGLIGHDKDGNPFGHAVNIVGCSNVILSDKNYKLNTGGTQKSRNDIRLKIYDSNYPGEIRNLNVRNKITKNGKSYAAIDYEFFDNGSDTREVANMYYQFTVMDENMVPFEYEPVVDIFSKDYSYMDENQSIDFDKHLEDYLNKYPSRKYWQDKEEYNRYLEDGFVDEGDEGLVKYE